MVLTGTADMTAHGKLRAEAQLGQDCCRQCRFAQSRRRALLMILWPDLDPLRCPLSCRDDGIADIEHAARSHF